MYDNVLEKAIHDGVFTLINTYIHTFRIIPNTLNSCNVQVDMTWFACVPLDWNRVQGGTVGATYSVLQGPPTGGAQGLLPLQ
jgi:hypothetical protein